MKDVHVKVSFTGYKCNAWPKIKVSFNNIELFDNEIQHTLVINRFLPASESNTLSIIHYGKNNDTEVDQEGKIIKDRHCLLDGIWINGIYFGLDHFSEHQIFYYTENGDKIITNYLGANGELKFEFAYPLWKFWEMIQ